MVARRHEISLRVLKNISRVSAAIEWNIAALTREIFFNTRIVISFLRATMPRISFNSLLQFMMSPWFVLGIVGGAISKRRLKFRINREEIKKKTRTGIGWQVLLVTYTCRVFSHDVTMAMLVSQTSPVGVDLFSSLNAFFCSSKFALMLATWVKTLLGTLEIRTPTHL